MDPRLVSGEAGVGKTSLARRFGEELDGKAHVLWGGCDARFTPRPPGPFVEIAHEAGARVATALPSTREATADRGWSPVHHSRGDLRVLRHGKRWCTAELVATCE